MYVSVRAHSSAQEQFAPPAWGPLCTIGQLFRQGGGASHAPSQVPRGCLPRSGFQDTLRCGGLQGLWNEALFVVQERSPNGLWTSTVLAAAHRPAGLAQSRGLHTQLSSSPPSNTATTGRIYSSLIHPGDENRNGPKLIKLPPNLETVNFPERRLYINKPDF